MTDAQKTVVMATLRDKEATEVHHGDCLGADAEFHAIATVLGIRTIAHPPIDTRLRAYCKADEIREPKLSVARDADVVAECEYLIAAPYEYAERRRGSGTWLTIRIARRTKTPHGIVYPGVGRGRHGEPIDPLFVQLAHAREQQ